MLKQEEWIGQLALEILEATEAMAANGGWDDVLPTAADLARKLNLRVEAVKKKLRILKEADLIHPVTVQPKRYRFNRWALREMDADSPLYPMFCDPESPYYIESARG